MGRETKVVTKTFTSPEGKETTLDVKLFPWEELNFVDTIKKEFNL